MRSTPQRKSVVAPPKRLSLNKRRRGESARSRPYAVFIAYADIPAAREALVRLNARARDAGCELLPMLWRFEQLDQPRWREVALREAERAMTLVVALGARATLSPGVETWLTTLTTRRRGAGISAAVFLGDETWTISLQQTRVASPSSALPSPALAEIPSVPMEAVCAA